ncbi:MAG: thioester reductase domain-containing protein [Myxococcota bacterium]
MQSAAPIDIEREVTLNESWGFHPDAGQDKRELNHVFLTGATGFLGTHLLAELLEQTNAQVYCLARSGPEGSATERIGRSLAFYQRWKEADAARIVALEGDLARPNLGLTESQFQMLAEQVDTIVHNGAMVNIMLPYSSAKGSNVFGTQEVLRLASLGRGIPLHYISTLGIFFGQNSGCVGEDASPIASLQRNGYQQSKWVAEGVVRLAQKRGLAANIYRAVRILGDSRSGIIGNFDDFLFAILEGCVELGAYPAVENVINFIPMDYASKAIIHIAKQTPLSGETFHLAHQAPCSWRMLFQHMIAAGYPMQALSYEEWTSAVDQAATKRGSRSPFGFLKMLSRMPNNIFAPKPAFDDRNTRQGLAGTGIVCPPVDAVLLNAYFQYFERAGLLRKQVGLTTNGVESVAG